MAGESNMLRMPTVACFLAIATVILGVGLSWLMASQEFKRVDDFRAKVYERYTTHDKDGAGISDIEFSPINEWEAIVSARLSNRLGYVMASSVLLVGLAVITAGINLFAKSWTQTSNLDIKTVDMKITVQKLTPPLVLVLLGVILTVAVVLHRPEVQLDLKKQTYAQ